MKFENITQVLEYLNRYETESDKEDFNLGDFAFWLNNNLVQKPMHKEDANDKRSASEQQNIDVQISILIGRMGKYARMYSKPILHNNQLSSADDYTFLATLMFSDSMTKSELIHYNLMDSVTSGSDVIKRLIKQELVETFDDTLDKRSKRVKITEKGKLLMFKTFNEMNRISDVITGKLKDGEKLFLLQYLKKLDLFHNEIYHNDRKSDIENIRDKYLD